MRLLHPRTKCFALLRESATARAQNYEPDVYDTDDTHTVDGGVSRLSREGKSTTH